MYLSMCLLIWRCDEAQSSTKSAEAKTVLGFFFRAIEDFN